MQTYFSFWGSFFRVFSDEFIEFGGKILRTSKNLPAPALVLLVNKMHY